MQYRTDVKMTAKMNDLMEGISALAGAFVAVVIDKYVPSFKYRSAVLGIIGIALVFVGFSDVLRHEIASAFMIGLGAVLSMDLLSYVPMFSTMTVTA